MNTPNCNLFRDLILPNNRENTIFLFSASYSLPGQLQCDVNNRCSLAHVKMVRHTMKYRRLKNLVSSIKQNPKVYWPAIFRFLCQNKKLLVEKTFLQTYPQRFMRELLEVGCSDLNLVKRILILHFRVQAYESLYRVNFAIDDPKLIAVCEAVCSPLDSHEIMNGFYNGEMIKDALLYEKVKLMTVLLRYGLSNITHEVSEWEYVAADSHILLFWHLCRGHKVRPKFVRIFGAASGKSGTDNRKRWGHPSQRILTIVRLIYVLTMKENSIADRERYRLPETKLKNCVKCLRLYFRATTEPHVSKDELAEFFRTYFCGIPEDLLQRMLGHYESLFREECASSYTPRTLKHLCRHMVRGYAVENKLMVLPELIESLKLPKYIARYLLCQC